MSVDYTAEIAQLEKLINSATESVSADGLSTKFSIDQARKRLIELQNLQSGKTVKRPRIRSIDLSILF